MKPDNPNTKSVNAVLHPTGLTVNRVVFTEAPLPRDVIQAFGNAAFREQELLDQGRPWRQFLVFDELGVYLLFDHEIGRVLDVNFCFSLSKSPASPASVFSGVLHVNGVRVVAGLKESSLPIEGEFHFVRRGGWLASSDTLSLRFLPAARRLKAVIVSFLKRPKFACEKNL